MTTPDIAEARRLADAIDPFARKVAPDHLTSKVAADQLRAMADELERLRAQVAPAKEQIEAGAKALAEKHWHWDKLGEVERDSFRARAGDVLVAAKFAAAPAQQAHPESIADQWLASENGGFRPTQQTAPSLTVGERGDAYIVSVVMVQEKGGGVFNTQNKLYGLQATSPEEAHGTALPLAQADFPDHRLHTICHWTLAQPAAQAEPVAPTWQPVTDADLANAEAFIMTTGAKGHIIPADLFTLRNITAHMIREVRATRVSHPPAQGIAPPCSGCTHWNGQRCTTPYEQFKDFSCVNPAPALAQAQKEQQA